MRPTFQVDFNPQNYDAHECKSFRDGDWIIFHCERCPEYERRLNWRTGEVRSRHTSSEIRHHGFHVPPQYNELFQSMN